MKKKKRFWDSCKKLCDMEREFAAHGGHQPETDVKATASEEHTSFSVYDVWEDADLIKKKRIKMNKIAMCSSSA